MHWWTEAAWGLCCSSSRITHRKFTAVAKKAVEGADRTDVEDEPFPEPDSNADAHDFGTAAASTIQFESSPAQARTEAEPLKSSRRRAGDAGAKGIASKDVPLDLERDASFIRLATEKRNTLRAMMAMSIHDVDLHAFWTTEVVKIARRLEHRVRKPARGRNGLVALTTFDRFMAVMPGADGGAASATSFECWNAGLLGWWECEADFRASKAPLGTLPLLCISRVGFTKSDTRGLTVAVESRQAGVKSAMMLIFDASPEAHEWRTALRELLAMMRDVP
eukprot:NODE_12402_length_1227_cov_3.467273.p1 GENE.NODE_12402_length_1227_cov_3.467273~~NODE_12402_length_1227_cov_3.467273.p1  ORF type:complete len:317 (+),score=94.50 NODE_12402_length_1227_cov_3.467273:119-952(+)